MKTFRQYIAEELGRTVTFGELPEDLQVLIAQFFDIHQQTKELAKLEQGEPMTVEEWDVDKFPEVNVAAVEDPGDERDERYALDIPHNEHPILVNGKEWIDGRHRVWAARQRGQKKIKVIDLKKYGLGPVGALGPIREDQEWKRAYSFAINPKTSRVLSKPFHAHEDEAHAIWFDDIGLPSSGPAFDSIQRGYVFIDHDNTARIESTGGRGLRNADHDYIIRQVKARYKLNEEDSSSYYSHWGWLEPNGKTKDLADDDGIPLSHMQAVRQLYKITYEQAFKQGYVRWYVTRDGQELGVEVIAIPTALERAMKFLMHNTYFTKKINIEIWMPSLRKAWKRETFEGSESKNEGDAHRLLSQARSAAVDGTLEQSA
jgi:hypothetical protein